MSNYLTYIILGAIRKRVVICFVLISLTSFSVFALDRYSVASGNWNATSTWSATSGGSGGASVPVAGDVVYIQNTRTVTVTADAACTSITFNGASATLTINSGYSLSVTGAITLNSAGANNTRCSITGVGTIACGSVQVGTDNPPGNANTRTTIMTSTNASFNISGNLRVSSFIGTFTNRRINSSFNLESGIVTLSGSVTTTNENAVNVSTFSMATGAQSGTLNLSGASPFNLSATVTSTITLNGTNALVNYTRANTQSGYVTTYTNLTLSGTSAKTFATTPTVNGILSMEGTATADITFGVVTYGANATLQYNTATERTVSSEEWITPFAASGGIIIAGSGTITLNEAKELNASVPFTINSGATHATNNYQLTFGGNFVNDGTFTAGSSPIVIANTMASQNIAGFTTTGIVSMTKTAGTATFTGAVNGGGLTINGSGGTLDLGSAFTHTFTGAWTRTAGTLNGGSSLLKIGGSVSGSGGTVTAGTGTVEWYAFGDQSCAVVTYNNLTISGSGNKTIAGDVTVNGMLTLTAGALSIGSNTLTLANNANLSYGTGSLTGSTTSNLTIGTGTAISLNAISGGLNNFNLSRNITLASDLSVNGTITLSTARITIGSNSLTLSGTAAISGADASNFIVADGTGQLKKVFAAGASGAYSFPVGDVSGDYSPVSLTLSSNSIQRTIGIRVTDAQQSNDGTIDDFISRYWSFTDDQAGTYTYDAEFTYITPADLTGSHANLRVNRWNGSAWTQYNTSGSSPSLILTGGTETTAQLNNSDFTGRVNPPVTYTWNQSGATANWTTASNWTPARLSPQPDDVMKFDNNGTTTATNIQTQTIGRLILSNNSNVSLQSAAAAQTLSIAGGTGTDLDIPVGSTLQLSSTLGNQLGIAFNTATADAAIDGSLVINANTAFTNSYDATNSNSVVSGTITNSGGSITSTSSNLRFGGSSVYNHSRNAGTVPTATWNSGTTINISGTTDTAPTGFDQTFGNLNIICGSLTGARTVTLTGSVTVQGNLTISGTSVANTMTLDPAGQNLTVNGTTTVNAYGILTDNLLAGSNRFDQLVTISANGLFSNTNNPPYEFRGGITNNGTLNAGTGTYTFTTNAQALTGTFSIPNLTVTGVTLTNNNTLTVSSALSGTGGLTQATNATLNLGGTSGIITLTTSNSGNTVNYSGSDQSVHSGSYNNLTVSGSGNKTPGGNVTVDGTLTLTAGTFTVGANTLTLNGPAIAGTPANLSASSSSSLVFGGTTAGIMIPTSVVALDGLSITNSSIVTLQSSPTVSGTFNPAGAGLSIGANTLTLNGQINCGTLSGGGSSNIIIGGSGSADLSAVTLNNLTVNRAVTMCGNVTVGGTLTLTSGIVQAGIYILKLTNTSPSGALSWTAGSFVNVTSGSFERTLAANLSGTGNNYLFPIGEGGVFKGLILNDVYTGVSGPVLRATVSATGASTGDDLTMGAVEPRYWYLANTNAGNLTSAKVQLYESGLDFTKTIGMAPASSGNYATIGGSSISSSVTSPRVLNPGPYFCIGSTIDTYYSYQSGDWSEASTWTSDPSGTLQTGSTVPGIKDKIVILAGRTVSLSADITATGLDITINDGGFLNQSDKRFTNTLAALRGQGTLLLASVNFPSATINSLINAGGGTVEYNNSSGFTIPASPATYNNLTINTPGSVATLLNNLTLNGDLNVKSGTFKINNDVSTAKLTLTINGDITVDNGAFITVGNGVTNTAIGGSGGTAPFLNYYLNFHTVIVKGDFTNNGTVKFTNLSYPLYNAFPPTAAGATSGAASVYFQGNTDNTVNCNGTTIFYNLILEKGIDQTFKLTINSSSYANFKLFGANSMATDGAVTSDPDLRKALWIRTGTLVMKGSAIIPSLSEGTAGNSDYYIPSKGALLIDGSDVVILSTADDYREINAAYSVTAPDNATIGLTGGTLSAIDIFGTLQVNSGYLSTRESGGLITSSVSSGQLIINGGTVDAKQFLSSTGSASFTQTGGLFILRGRFQRTPLAYSSVSDLINVSAATLNTSRATSNTSSAYGSFNLEQTTNIFSMSGGTIRIYDVCGIAGGELEAFDVKSSSSNINVTGGTIEIIPVAGTVLADAASYSIYSNAPLSNLVINRTSSSSTVVLRTPLTVQNDISFTSGELTSGNFDITVGGDFTIENGFIYTTGTNTTTLNGTADQIFTINTGSALSLNKLTINKPAGIKADLAGSQNTLNINDNFRLVVGTLNDNGKTINVAKDVYNSGLHSGSGKIVFNGIAAQSIDGDGIFQNIELNNNSGTAPVSLIAGTTINGQLTFSRDKLFNISTYNLILNAGATISNASSTRYIQTAGNAGDGGITRVFDSTTPFNYPIGAPTTIPVRSVKYTPVSIGFTSAPSVYGSITVIPVGYEHPATTTNGQSLTYFWRIKSSGFSGIAANSVTHSFIYDQSDVVGTEGNYIPVLYTRNDYTWRVGTNANPPINTTTNTFSDWSTPSNSTNYLDADYTAGDASFGTPRTFYSIASSAWNLNTTWSYTSGGTAVPAGAVEGTNFPGINSIVVIENNRTVNLTADQSCASLQIQSGSVLDIYTWTGSKFSMVLSSSSGNNGLFRLTTAAASPGVFSFPSNSDFSDFNNNHGTTEFYDINGAVGTEYILPPDITTYGNLILTAKGGDNLILPNNSYTTIKGDLTVTGDNPDAWVTMSWLTPLVYSPVLEKTVRVTGNMYINNGTFLFLDDQAPQHLVVDGNVTIAPGAMFDVYNGYPVNNGTNPRSNSFEIGGSFINNSNLNPSARFKTGNNYVNLIFSGNTSSSITSTGGAVPNTIFNKVAVNKGNSQSTTLTVDIAGSLSTPDDNWLTLQNGTLRYMRSNPGSDFKISTTTPFNLPSTSGLYVDYANSGGKNILIGNSNSDANDLLLNGKLTVVNGNVYIGPVAAPSNNNDIEYSGSGSSAIEVRGGNLTVNGQIRRPVATTNGNLNFTQSGGNVIINGNNALTTKAKLEILNDGSQFNMSGGTLTIVRGGGTTYGDLYIRPSSNSVSGGTIVFSNVTPNTLQNYKLDANIPLFNLTVTGAAGAGVNANLGLLVSSLTLDGTFTLANAQSILNANSINVSFGGNLVNNGNISFGTNTTTFSGSVQTISGSSITNFYNLNVSSASSLTVNTNFSVTQNLLIGTGSLVLGNKKVTLSGNLTNNGSFTDDNTGGGISFSGSTLQQITGTGAYGRLEINNSSGVIINNDITLQNNLALTQGVLDINKYQLTLTTSSYITGAPYSATKMIKADGVTSSLGLRKFFTAAPQAFTFPVGVTGKYTPAIWDITASTKVGSIRVNPINTNHPTVTDPASVLGYYWQIESSGITLCDADVLLQYMPGDVYGNESNYVAAKLELPGIYWYETATGPATDNVDESNHQILFHHLSSSNLNGDYTAGIDIAIPGEVPTYVSNKDGNWNDVSVWTPVGLAPPCPGGGPNGSNVIIENVVTVNVNKVSVLTAIINNKLRIVSPTYGHNLGVVSGDGTIYLENGNLPAGSYGAFTSCTGNGTIEYGGSGTYTIIASLYNNVPNIFFTGTGTRILPNKDLTICKRLVIDGPTLDNSVNNRKLTITGTMERYNSGAFTSGTGSSPLATVTFSGTSLQSLGGSTGDFSGSNKFNNLEINNSLGLNIGTNGLVEVNNELLLTSGIITTSPSNRLVLLNTSSSAVTPSGGSASSFVNGPLIKQIANGGQFLYPIGKGSLKGHNFTLTSAAGSTLQWTAEYFMPNPTATTLTAPLAAANRAEYWSVLTSTTASAKVKIGWDPLSDLTPLQTQNGISDMRVGEEISGSWNNQNSATTGDNSNGDVATSDNVSMSGTPKNFTTASITPAGARASFTSAAAVCGSGGIPVSFTSFGTISLNYTLNYTLNGVPQTQVNVTSLPYTLPAASPGAYKLTAFTYNNGANNGVVDQTTVNVYANPTAANAGSDQSLCGVSGTVLAGNSPVPYPGLWTIVSGAGGTLVNSTLYNTVFTGVLGEGYVLRWTITNASCSSYDDVTISFPVVATQPSTFTAATTPVCRSTGGHVYTVQNVPGNTYSWSYSGTGATITGSGNSVTIAFNASATSGTLSVTASNSCGTSPARTLPITVNPVPVATFSYTGNPYCSSAANPSPVFSGGGVAGIFSSTAGLVFVSTATGRVDIAASTPGTYTVTNTIAAAGGCSIVTATSDITIINYITWTGAISSNWNVAGNWYCGVLPDASTDVVIPDVTNEPVLSGGAPGAVKNLTIESGSSLTVSGNTLRITGTVTNNGTYTASAAVIEMNGTTAQTIDANLFAGNSIKDIIINNPAGVTLLGSLSVTGIVNVQNGVFASGEYLTLSSTAAGTALIDGSGGGSITGNVTMQRHLPSAYGYKYFSSPFQAARVSEFADDVDLLAAFTTFYKYDESRTSSGWVNYKLGTNLLFPITGYAVNFGSDPAAKTADIKGEVNNGNLSVTLYNNNKQYTKGMNLVGNPYPSPIDWDAPSGWTKTNIDDALYFFAAGTDDQYVGTYSTYINGIASADGLASNIIPAMQGFFVHVSDLGPPYPITGTLGMTNSVRTTDLNRTFIKGGKAEKSLVRVTATPTDNKNKKDYFVIYYDVKADIEFDSQLDALKIFNTDLKVPNLYAVTPGGSKQSISGVSYTSEKDFYMPLGLKVNKAGTIEFSIEDVDGIYKDMRIFILDKLTGTEQELGKNNDYRVSLAIGEYLNRFYLNFYGSTTGLPDPQPVSNSVFNIYSYNGNIKGEINTITGNNGTLVMTNLLGQKVYETEILVTGYFEFSPGLKDGIYIATYVSGNFRSSKKLLIKN